MLEERVTILQTIKEREFSVSDLIKQLDFRNEDVISLLHAMENEELIYFLEKHDSRKKGRPKRVPKITVLGERVLKDFQKCTNSLIKINQNDVRSVQQQISLRHILENRNISPYQRFFELTEVAFRIKNSITH